ncbi:putative L-ascorbate peroxidase 6, chloroplastic [Zea mays]|uniref:Putative L-ascorbate peroxidase 6, chloroplastic n=1 Tax=Zea mays TaxID=4577 RepID=A0A3L6FL51_MAIZE|nr:putative L-ascorbate peroxidase 6, chloroplastic [Zea mays]
MTTNFTEEDLKNSKFILADPSRSWPTGWHDAGTYDKNIFEWPKCSGANGSLRFKVELKHWANADLVNALKLIQPIKDKFSSVTYADLFQLASAIAIEEAGVPKIPMIYGTVDVIALDNARQRGGFLHLGPEFVFTIKRYPHI